MSAKGATGVTGATTMSSSQQRVVPTIESLTDFEHKLPGYLNANKTLAILLDYDGTLAPIASNPNKTAMSAELEQVLNQLAEQPDVFMAVISGRGLKNVQECVGIAGIHYAGNHGLEIEYPDGTRHDYKLPDAIQAAYIDMVRELNDKVHKLGAWVEDKRVSLTYHYRDTPVEHKQSLIDVAVEIMQRHGFRVNRAHEAVEAKPPVNWNKGEAALYLLKDRFGDDWSNKTKVVFAGDDTTDEDAMRLLQGLGKSFRVSTDPNVQTYADFRLPRQELVTDLLKWVANTYSV